MPIRVGTNVYGVQPVLQVLRRLDPELHKLLVAELKTKSEPVRRFVAQGYPTKPMTNWTLYGRTARGRKMPDTAGPTFPRYQIDKVEKGVQVRVGGRRRVNNMYPILSFIQKDAAGQIYDLGAVAQSKAGTQFVANLNKGGEASRVMWKRVEQKYPEIEDDIAQTIKKITDMFTDEIAYATQKRDAQSTRARRQGRSALGRFA
jgi:hypothetical protein